jgi:hypothetical protein
MGVMDIFTEEIKMSPFEEVFGEEEDLENLIATIRDTFDDKINSKIPASSIMSSPKCVLYAIFKLLDEDLEDKEYRSWEEKKLKEK